MLSQLFYTSTVHRKPPSTLKCSLSVKANSPFKINLASIITIQISVSLTQFTSISVFIVHHYTNIYSINDKKLSFQHKFYVNLYYPKFSVAHSVHQHKAISRLSLLKYIKLMNTIILNSALLIQLTTIYLFRVHRYLNIFI